MAYDEHLAQRVRRELAKPDVTERKMFGGLAFLVGGRMCCGVQGTDLMVRVPVDMHEALLRRPHARPMDFTGKPLKGFLYVSAAGLRTAASLRRWIAYGRESVAVAATPATAQPRQPRRRGAG